MNFLSLLRFPRPRFRGIGAFAFFVVVGAALAAFAQSNNYPTPGGASVGAQVPLCIDSAGQAIACPGTTLTNSGSGTTGATTSTLTATASSTVFICGFRVDSQATAATSATMTIAGLLGGTMTMLQPVAASPNVASFTQDFNPCLPASAVNTNIVVTSAAAGTGGVTRVNAWGYRK